MFLVMLLCCFCVFFFFQAEDGIRDLTVTGVQTCALPICRGGEALAASRRAIALDPRMVEAHTNLAAVLMDRDEFDEAEQTLLTTTRLAPAQPQVLCNLAELYRRQGRWDEALRAADEASAAAAEFAAPVLNGIGDEPAARRSALRPGAGGALARSACPANRCADEAHRNLLGGQSHARERSPAFDRVYDIGSATRPPERVVRQPTEGACGIAKRRRA